MPLSQPTLKLIDSYFRLPIGAGCPCPYFNNKRTKIRGGLSALVGKGTPDEIATEAKLIALRKKVKLETLSSDELKKFLVENGLGIDCSGFAYHILDTESRAIGLGSLASAMQIRVDLFRKMLYRLRPEKNTSVAVLALPKNSSEIALEKAEAGDIILILKTGPRKDYDHVLIVRDVSVDAIGTKTIYYVHSYTWPSDGKYGHGIKSGEIRIANPIFPITEAKWTENGATDRDNYTFLSALEAEETSLRRLTHFTKKS